MNINYGLREAPTYVHVRNVGFTFWYAGGFLDTSEKPEQTTRSSSTGKKLQISVVEGSFRRIAGIREFADASGTFLVRVVEILREPGKSLGFYIHQGDGWERKEGVFVSRVILGSIVETNGLLSIGDEITKVNDIDVTQMPLENVAVIMRYVKRLFLTVKVLTSPTLIRTYSQRRSMPRVGPSNAQSHTSTPIKQQGGKNRQPFHCLRNVYLSLNDEGVVPYAYTRIQRTQETRTDESLVYTKVNETSTDAAYDTIDSAVEEQQRSPKRGWISTESLCTLGSRSSEELDFGVIDYKNIDQSVDTQQYYGRLTLLLNKINNIIPPSDDAPLLCTISFDSEATVEISIDASQLEKEVQLDLKYLVQLASYRRMAFNFVNGLLSSTKDIPLSYFIPKPNEPHSIAKRTFTLILNPIGQLSFSLSFCPLPSAIPRWVGRETSTATLKELVASNPSATGLPPVVERAIQIIQEYGIETAGLYQISASEKAKSLAFSACLSHTLHPSQLRSLVSEVTVHAFTGVLKDFFFNLPESLFTSEFTAGLQDTVQLSKEGAQQAESDLLSSFIDCLPEEANKTTCALLAHFRTVCQHGHMNRMTIEKIALLFAPLLFTPTYSHRDSAEQISSGNFITHVNILKALILQQK